MGQRKIAAFIFLNLNLYVFLIHAIEGIKIEREGEWESYTQIIFEPLWTIKENLFGYQCLVIYCLWFSMLLFIFIYDKIIDCHGII